MKEQRETHRWLMTTSITCAGSYCTAVPKTGPDTRSNLEPELGTVWDVLFPGSDPLEFQGLQSAHSVLPWVIWSAPCCGAVSGENLNSISYDKCKCCCFQFTTALEIKVVVRELERRLLMPTLEKL